jgi:hypothetical protein
MPHDEVTPYNRPLAQPGSTQGYGAANVEAINEQFRITNQNFRDIEKTFETLRYNMRAAIGEDVDKLRDVINKNVDKLRADVRNDLIAIVDTLETLEVQKAEIDLEVSKLRNEMRDEIRKEFAVDKLRDEILRDEIRKELTAEIASLRAETLKTLNENLKGADKSLVEFGFNVRKVIDEGVGKIREEIRKEFSIDNLVAEIRKEYAAELAALHADTTIQLAAMRADITTHQTRQPPPRKVPPSDLKRRV